MKKIFKRYTFYLMAILTAFFALFLSSCVVGSGDISTEERMVQDFDSISASSGINVFIEEGAKPSIEIEAEDNIIPLITTEVKNSWLEIGKKIFIFSLNNKKPINIFIEFTQLDEIKISSGSSVSSDYIETDELKIVLDSGSKADLNIIAKEIEIDAGSGSVVNIEGQVKLQKIQLNSGSSYNAEELASQECIIELNSGSTARINSMDSIDAEINSGSNLEYLGNPELDIDISSGGNIKKIE
jgi:hypothetical protein